MMFFNPTFNRYLKCYREGVKMGFVKENNRPCYGEQLHPGRVKKDCYNCPYFKEKELNNGYI